MRDLVKFLIALVFTPFIVILMIPFFIFMDWLADNDFYATKELVETWLSWITFRGML